QIEKEIQATMELQIEAKVSNSGKRFTRYSTKLEELSQEEVRLESNLEKISIRLVKVEHALKNRTSVETTTKELLQSASNRTKLRAIFLDLINKVVIVSIDKNTVLADVFIQLDGVTLPLTLKVFLDVSGMRLKKKRFAYRAASDIGFELSYEENKLLTDIEFIQRALFTIKDNDGLIPILDVAYVPDNHILTIPTNQKGK
ncbi:MAG: hypothetical protein RL204_637, partial [Bacteroidota bacterium]